MFIIGVNTWGFLLGVICVSLAGDYYEILEKAGEEKYVLFFIVAYVYGIFLQEFGVLCDKKFVCKILYGGRTRELFLQKSGIKRFGMARLKFILK